MSVRFAATQWGLPGEGLYAPELVKEAGLDGLQLDLGSWENGLPLSQRFIRERYLESAAALGISYPSVVANDLITYHLLNGPDTPKGEIVRAILEALIDAAQALGAEAVMIPSFYEGSIRTVEDMKRAALHMRFACDRAAEKGILVTHESAMLPEDQQRFFEIVDRENLRVFYDSRNYMILEGHDQGKILNGVWDFMAPQVHIKDGFRQTEKLPDGTETVSWPYALLGAGECAYDVTKDILLQRRFEGWIILETMYSHSPLNRRFPEQLDGLRADIRKMREDFRPLNEAR